METFYFQYYSYVCQRQRLTMAYCNYNYNVWNAKNCGGTFITKKKSASEERPCFIELLVDGQFLHLTCNFNNGVYLGIPFAIHVNSERKMQLDGYSKWMNKMVNRGEGNSKTWLGQNRNCSFRILPTWWVLTSVNKRSVRSILRSNLHSQFASECHSGSFGGHTTVPNLYFGYITFGPYN
jgi:hypothetical protein